MRRKINKKSWRRLFVNMLMISLVFAVVLIVANGSLFTRVYTMHEKTVLRNCADKIAQLDLDDQTAAEESLRNMEDSNSVVINLFRNGATIYSTIGQAGHRRPGLSGFDLLIPNSDDSPGTHASTDRYGGVYSNQIGSSGTEYIVYSRTYGDLSVEVSIGTAMITASARFATRFFLLTMLAALLLMTGVNVWFSLRFTKPISVMNGIAQKMAGLDFSEKVPVADDEIGELAASLNTMSDSLAHALSELQKKNERLEGEIEAQRRLDTMRTEFVANVSHELKTPLAILQGYAEGLEGGLADDPAKREHYCRVIREETERMRDLVILLLELSRYESGAPRRSESFDLAAGVLNTVDFLSGKLEESGATLDLALPERLPAFGDPLMLEQAVRNYVSNAVSHVNRGGVVRLYVEPYGNRQRFCVYNSGSHIAEGDLENVWQSFFRADKSHNRAEGRFGLGLSIVKAILTTHGADFGVFNTEDGVVFWFEIPEETSLA